MFLFTNYPTINVKCIRHLKNKYEDYITNAVKKAINKGEIYGNNISELRSKYTMEECLKYIPLLGEDKINSDELKTSILDFLRIYPNILEAQISVCNLIERILRD